MASPSLFANLARAAKVLALLLFFLPWVTVSCSADGLQRLQAAEQGRAGLPPSRQVQLPTQPDFAPSLAFAKASGLNMAIGTVQLIPLPDFNPNARATQPQQAPEVAPEIAVIAGAALILIALIVTFLKSALGFALAAGGSLLALAAFCFSVFIHYPPAIIEAVAGSFSRMGNQSGGQQPTLEQMSQILVVKPDTVFYFVLIALVAAAVLDIVAMKKLAPKPEAVF